MFQIVHIFRDLFSSPDELRVGKHSLQSTSSDSCPLLTHILVPGRLPVHRVRAWKTGLSNEAALPLSKSSKSLLTTATVLLQKYKPL